MRHGLAQHTPVLVACFMAVACQNGAPPTTESHFTASVVIDDNDLVINRGNVFMSSDDKTVGPELLWGGARGTWKTGIDVANNGGSRDLVLAAKYDWPAPGDTNDLIYVAHNDASAPTVGIGVTPPSPDYRLQLSGEDSQPAMGGLLLRRSVTQSGDLLTIADSGGVRRWWIDSDLWLKGASSAVDASIAIKADDLRGRPLVLGRADGTAVYGFEYARDGSTSLHLRYITGGMTNLTLTTSGVPDFPNGLTATSLHIDSPAVPTSSGAPCTRGDIRFDDDYVYVCVTTNTWKRSALTSW